jgi:Fe-S-cluster containining protein
MQLEPSLEYLIGIYAYHTNNLNTTLRVIKTFQNLRFNCKRCAALCCKLGPPRLSIKDLINIIEHDHNNSIIKLSQAKKHIWTLRTKPNGECIFLRKLRSTGEYMCTNYA